MAKSKKDINAFQKAMLTNTKVIGKEESEKDSGETIKNKTEASTKKIVKATTANKTDNLKTADEASKINISLNQKLYQKIEKLSRGENIAPDQFIEASLEFVLKMEGYLFDNE